MIKQTTHNAEGAGEKLMLVERGSVCWKERGKCVLREKVCSEMCAGKKNAPPRSLQYSWLRLHIPLAKLCASTAQ
jgi:hypothetical protein